MSQLRLVSVELVPERPTLPPDVMRITDALHDAGYVDVADAVLDRYQAYQHVLDVAQQCLAGNQGGAA